ncbi:L-ascorbate metabolism protein UlaG (beta-lactamase superfamily) [Saonia flava]|uniref:L-ascorbate metabolism protein UlaG (Beta-lactamase superfamily) n=1 Tax=Saonia flava TaxID=523696 RepID=A0A846QWF7_9FLAO|nr:MBL fold metallo-hydrolase [Saonia flava]NJB72671.1 L-ascorbate metabolism protein UlaG (beta-lactamase superfamily) [Saonia flava]
MFKKILVRLISGFLMLGLITVLFVNFHPVFGGESKGEILEKMKETPNYSNGKFTNLYPTKNDFSWDDYKKIFGKMFKGNPNKKPSKSLPVIKWDKSQLDELRDSETSLVWYGHSAFYLKMNGKNILIDPMFGDYPSPVPYIMPKRFNDTLPIAIEDLPEIDIIIFSHDHYDHLDYGSIKRLKGKTKKFIVPLGLGAHLKKWGVEESKISELYWEDSITVADITFTCTPAQHFSGRGLLDKMSTLWCSWVIDGKHKLFFSGDSGYFEGFKKIGKEHGPFDVCMMECGQYDELWKDIHMMPEETAQAHLDLKGNMLIPIHWGGFTLSNHDWDDPVQRLYKASMEKNINLSTPIIGEKIIVGKEQQFSDWWKQ